MKNKSYFKKINKIIKFKMVSKKKILPLKKDKFNLSKTVKGQSKLT